MEERKITDLIVDALKYDDYEFRINFVVGGLICEEANDTPEKEAVNKKYIRKICEFCRDYSGDKKEFFDHLHDTLKGYLDEQ